jgi:DNA repair exonuclease SbcCD nuclease subunit
MRVIGDPHLGREFIANVPLERRGEREAMMMTEFEKQLNDSKDMTVIVGDLFEHPIVSFQTLYKTCELILVAAAMQPLRPIIIMAGNHDLNKATDKKAYIHIMEMIFERVPNVHVLLLPSVLFGTAFFPWQYGVTAIEQLELLDWTTAPITAIGHWDLESYGGDDSHLCPAQELADRGITRIISGHWHVSGDYIVDGIPVYCTGSMQPMTHAEDKEGKLYVTLTKQEYEKLDPETLRDNYVRVYINEDEEVIAPPTCLGFKVERNRGSRETERVNLGTFDMNDILKQAFTTFDVNKPVQDFIKENLNGST